MSKAEQLVEMDGLIASSTLKCLVAAQACNTEFIVEGIEYTFKDGSQVLLNQDKFFIQRRFDPAVEWRVVCRDDDDNYVFATRQVWMSRVAAYRYAGTVCSDRRPIVMKCTCIHDN